MGAKPKKEKKHGETEPQLAYYQLFRYGTWPELCATALGVLGGLLSGGAAAYNLVQFGELNTALIERSALREHESSYQPLLSIFGGGRILVNASQEENMKALIEDGVAAIAGMFVTVVISVLLCVLSVALINWSALRQITRIRKMFLIAALRQDMSWFDTDTDFNLASKMSEDMVKLKDGIGEKISVVCNLFGTAILCLAQGFPLGWELTLACATVVPFSIIASVFLTNYQSVSSYRELVAYSQAGKVAEEVLQAVRTVVAFGGETKEVDRYGRLLAPAERYGRRRGVFSGLGYGFNWVLTYAMNTIGIMYGARLILGDMDKSGDERRYLVGTLFSVTSSVYMATQSITLCVPHMEVFAAARGAARGIFELIERQPVIDPLRPGGASPRRVLGNITLEDIHFSYPSRPNSKILKGFNLTVRSGESVALVGSSGCGKSTILQLIQRLYDPQAGCVRLDGKDLKDLNLGWMRSCLGVVGQEPVLFRGTIHENIALGCPGATQEEVQRVADMAFAHEFIVKLPEGYDTMIGERGASLSGGQKQRIAIARSLLREPAVLLLDEATSALDPVSERQVQAALDRASEGRTTITVSHRLSTIVNCHRIIVMDQGRIVEEGTHEELINARGAYYKLVSRSEEDGDLKPPVETVPEEDSPPAPPPPLGDAPVEDTDDSHQKVEPRSRSIRRTAANRRHSVRSGGPGWQTPRGSIASVVSVGVQSFMTSGADNSDEEDDDEEEKVQPISDWRLLKLNAAEWPYMVVGSVAAIIQGCCFPGFAMLFGYTGGVFANPDRSEVLRLADLYAGMFIVVAAAAGISMFLQGAAFTSAGLKMTTRLRRQYFAALLKQEMGYFDRAGNTVGAMCARLSSDAAAVQGATGLRIGLTLQGMSSVIVGFFIAISYNWKLTLVGTAFLPIMVGSIWMEGIMTRHSANAERRALESATAIATEALVSIRTVQSLGVEQVFIDKFRESSSSARAALAAVARYRGLVLGLGVYVPYAAFISVIVYGASLVSKQEVEYRTVILVTEAIMYGAYMLGHSLVSAPSFNAAKASGARCIALISREPAIRTEPSARDKKDWAATGAFNIKGVEFSYPTRPEQRILRGIDLKVEAGKTVALVGSSGCGKSTVLQLFQRFYDPTTGNIELDGRDHRAELPLPRLRRQLGAVQQEPVLFARSLAENIAYGDNSRRVAKQEVIDAAKAANIHGFIVSLPKGYDTQLGSGGAQLSGGQKQRVCIARALLRDPRLLLLDEATSALDAHSERAVSEALEKAAQGRTCITIAHRLKTVQNADHICVLDKGKIVERGNHQELIAQKGLYWRMCRGQHMA